MTNTQKHKIKQTILCKLGFHKWRYLGRYDNRRVCTFCLVHQTKITTEKGPKWKYNNEK